MNTSRHTVNGFALPLVLIILALLTALSFGLTRLVSANMQFLQERKTEWAEELQIRDALEKAIHMLLVGKYDPTSVSVDSASLPLNSAPAMINGLTVRVQSWSGLYSLSLLGHQNTNAVFRQMMDSKSAQRVSAELGDWIDEDTRGRFRYGRIIGYFLFYSYYSCVLASRYILYCTLLYFTP